MLSLRHCRRGEAVSVIVKIKLLHLPGIGMMNTGDSNILFFHALNEKSVVRMQRLLVIIFFALTVTALQNCDEHRSRNSSEDDFFGHTLDTTFAHADTIAYSDSLISVINSFDTLGVTISIDGGDVAVNSTITEMEIHYILSGEISDGNSLVTYAPTRVAYCFLFSSPFLQNGATYKVFSGGNCTGATVTNGLYSGGTYFGGTQKGSFTISSKVTTATL